MDKAMEQAIMRTVGYITIGIGCYLLYKSGTLGDLVENAVDDIIEGEFTIIND